MAGRATPRCRRHHIRDRKIKPGFKGLPVDLRGQVRLIPLPYHKANLGQGRLEQVVLILMKHPVRPAIILRESIRVDLGAEAASAAAPRGLCLLVLGRARRAYMRAHDRAVQQSGGPIRLDLQWARRRGQTPWLHQAA